MSPSEQVDAKICEMKADLCDEALEFFVLFARFEFAMKRSGKYLKGEIGKKAEPSWHRLARQLQESLFEKVKSEKSVELLFSDPPRRQIVKSAGVADFEDRAMPPTNLQELFHAIKTARNNLFHGGKHAPTEDKVRDIKLFKAASLVLKRVLADDIELRDKFLEALR